MGSLSPSPGTLLRATGVGYTFASGRRAVESVDLELRAEEVLALVGPNGSGKTTLLRLLAHDLRPTAGRLEFDGPAESARGRPDPARIGYVPDEAVHFEELTGLENARSFARACGQPSDEAIGARLADFDLAAAAHAPAAELSFGMRRKLMIVEAVLHAPALLLLDEPTVGLDPAAALALAALIREQAAQRGAVVLATNDLGAAALATRIAFLHRGRKIADAPPAELLRSVHGTTRIDVTLEAMPPSFAPPPGLAAVATAHGFVVESAEGTAVLPELCAALVRAGARIRDLRVREPGLADVFRHLTGEDLAPKPAREPAETTPSGPAPERTRRTAPWRRR